MNIRALEEGPTRQHVKLGPYDISHVWAMVAAPIWFMLSDNILFYALYPFDVIVDQTLIDSYFLFV